jgi:hypothetical protein
MTTLTRPATARADATDADIAAHAEAADLYVTARANAQAARAAETAAYAVYVATVRAVFFNG